MSAMSVAPFAGSLEVNLGGVVSAGVTETATDFAE